MKVFLDKLIGAQLISISDEKIIIKLNGFNHEVFIDLDSGDCCGFAQLKTNLFYQENNCRNPVITNIETKKIEDEYGESDRNVITFLGESKKLFDIDAECGSSSGWEYGACIKLVCKTLDLEEIISSY